MRYNRLGNSGLVVSELCLGAMTFGNRPSRFFAHELDQHGATALVKQAVESGINFIDTANVYTQGQSEEFVGGALKALGIARQEIVIATKGMGPMGQGPNDAGMSAKHLLHHVDESLARLGLDHVDLYQIHGWDPLTPMEEALRALEDIVRSGRARYVGVSNWAAWQIVKALGIAERRGWDKFVSLQAHYTVASRDLERELGPMLASESLGLLVWSPLAGGLLSGKYAFAEDGTTQGEGRRAKLDFPRVDKARAAALVEAMRPMADARGLTVPAIALAWLLHQPVVSSVIVGAKRADQLAENIAASEVELTAGELAILGELGALELEYPGWAIGMQTGTNSQRISPRREPR
ncbi:aldo/keto reductase [Erythrobacter sp. SG61-1L]|uniref:aldo/keto reductase n=1 Tax=Erythrobacter sp. SG61-1L TaxID=1603897 RepID=UPI0006C911F7|nr:aldo/keto reductase [Erythrobacter sp. SG61-1L]KPL69042.1 aldo/keto reductase [Erythrobacter sp. SG61-1L]